MLDDSDGALAALMPPAVVAERVQERYWSYWGLYSSPLDGSLAWVDDTGERLTSPQLANYLLSSEWKVLK